MAESKTRQPSRAASDESTSLDDAQQALEEARAALDSAAEAMSSMAGSARSAGRAVALRTRESLDDAKQRLIEAKDLMADISARSRKRLEELWAELSERYDELKVKAFELRGTARDRLAGLELGQRRDEVLAFLRERPGTSVMIALVAGFTIGYLSRNRDS